MEYVYLVSSNELAKGRRRAVHQTETRRKKKLRSPTITAIIADFMARMHYDGI